MQGLELSAWNQLKRICCYHTGFRQLYGCRVKPWKKYDRLTSQDQLIFLKEAERVFDAFDKVPNMLWEEEYNKYMEVLDKYKDIKMVRWVNDN